MKRFTRIADWPGGHTQLGYYYLYQANYTVNLKDNLITSRSSRKIEKQELDDLNLDAWRALANEPE